MKQQRKSSRQNVNRLFLAGLLFLASCNNENKPLVTKETVDSSAVFVPAAISYNIVNEFPHDPLAFTEGLEYKDGFLYESIGQYRSSDVRKVDLKTGKVLLSQKMDARYFGEGLTILNGKIYQLTYREGKGFVYDLATLKQERTFTIEAPEGWGMCNNGSLLIFDDGSNLLHFIDPNTFKEIKRLAVTDEHGPVKEINELELMHGFLYANQWQTDLILKIDTSTGSVVEVYPLVDFVLNRNVFIEPRVNLPVYTVNSVYDAPKTVSLDQAQFEVYVQLSI